MMVILEGADGTGKSVLARRLAAFFQYPVLKRDKQDPFLWAISEMSAWSEKPLRIYDRFPLVGEYIYGPIWRGTIHPSFVSQEIEPVKERFYQDTLIIYCRPPVRTILSNCRDYPQTDNMAKDLIKMRLIIDAYDQYFSQVNHHLYDYTSDHIEDLTPIILKHEREWDLHHGLQK